MVSRITVNGTNFSVDETLPHRKRSRAALLLLGTGFVVSPTKQWGFEPTLWSRALTTRRVLGIGGLRS
jgi:hypothetical protein